MNTQYLVAKIVIVSILLIVAIRISAQQQNRNVKDALAEAEKVYANDASSGIEEFKKVIAEFKDDTQTILPVRFRLGELLYNARFTKTNGYVRDKKGALEQFQEIVKYGQAITNYGVAQFNVAKILGELWQTKEAIKEYRKLIDSPVKDGD